MVKNNQVRLSVTPDRRLLLENAGSRSEIVRYFVHQPDAQLLLKLEDADVQVCRFLYHGHRYITFHTADFDRFGPDVVYDQMVRYFTRLLGEPDLVLRKPRHAEVCPHDYQWELKGCVVQCFIFERFGPEFMVQVRPPQERWPAPDRG